MLTLRRLDLHTSITTSIITTRPRLIIRNGSITMHPDITMSQRMIRSMPSPATTILSNTILSTTILSTTILRITSIR